MTLHAPDLHPSNPETTGHLRDTLALVAADKTRQLQDLDHDDDDPMTAVRRTTLLQTLSEIAAARGRIDQGTYGACARCGDEIPAERLTLRPWAATCVGCAHP
jgi:RNA polymerase-binding transcription factor DksA